MNGPRSASGTTGTPDRFAELESEYNPLLVFAWAGVVGVAAGLVGTIFRVLITDASRWRLALFAWGIVGRSGQAWRMSGADVGAARGSGWYTTPMPRTSRGPICTRT
jgi:hypothetical protein